jgi:hypothetical protein
MFDRDLGQHACLCVILLHRQQTACEALQRLPKVTGQEYVNARCRACYAIHQARTWAAHSAVLYNAPAAAVQPVRLGGGLRRWLAASSEHGTAPWQGGLVIRLSLCGCARPGFAVRQGSSAACEALHRWLALQRLCVNYSVRPAHVGCNMCVLVVRPAACQQPGAGRCKVICWLCGLFGESLGAHAWPLSGAVLRQQCRLVRFCRGLKMGNAALLICPPDG